MSNNPRLVALASLMIPIALANSAGAQTASKSFAIVKRISGPDGGWDYAFTDSASRRLYVARDNGVMSVDLDSGSVTAQFVPGAGVKGIAQVAGTQVLASTNSGKNTVTFFDGKTGKVLGEVATAKGPDSIAYEPKSGLIAVMNHGGNITLIDPTSRAVSGTVHVGGELEFAAADGDGRLYVNVMSANQVAVVDVAARKVIGRVSLKGCEEPTGLAYDDLDKLVISVCVNGVAEFIDPKTHRQVAQVSIGKIPDAVIWDKKHRLAFVPSFMGTLTVISVQAPNDIKAIQSLPTQVGTRTGAVDEATGSVYLPTAKMNVPMKDGQIVMTEQEHPTPVPGTFEVLVVASR